MAVYPRPPTSGLLSMLPFIVVAPIVAMGLWVLYRESRWAGKRTWLRFAGGALFGAVAAVFATALAILALSPGEYTALGLGVFAFLLAIGGVIGTLQAAKSEDVLNIETVAHTVAAELREQIVSFMKNLETSNEVNIGIKTPDALIAEIFKDSYRARVMKVGRALERHAIDGSDALLRVADNVNSVYRLMQIANSLDRLASALREKNLE